MTLTHNNSVPQLRFPRFEGDWETCKLGDLGPVSMCKRVMKDETKPTGDVPFYKIGTFGRESDAFIDRELFDRYRERYSFPNTGDILISAAGTIGRLVVYDGSPAYFQDSNIVWVANDERKVANAFLHFCYQNLRWTTENTTIARLYNDNLRNIDITAPTLPEQRKIAGFLDAVDTKVAQLAEKKHLLEDYKKGCMQQLFSQEIRFKDEDGNKFPDWEEKRLGEVFSWVNTNSLSRERLTLDGGQVQNIHYGDIHTKFSANFRQGAEALPYIKDASPEDFKPELFCQVGDIVIADASEDYADIGKAIEIVELSDTPLVAGLHTYIARPCEASVHTGFAGYLLRSAPTRRQIERIAQGISVLGISKRNLEKLTFFLPHPAEQRKIADFLSALDRKIELVAEEHRQAQTFKKSLIQQMFV